MRKIFLIVLFFFSILSLGQRKEFAEAVNLYNNKNFSESVLILEKLLNADYGKLNKEQELYSLMMRANAYYELKDYSKAYENAQIYLTFLKNNNGLISYAEEKKVINEVEKFIENTKALISVDDTNSVITSSNTSTVQNSENKSVEDNRSATLSVTGSEKTIEEEKTNALTTQNSETKSVADDRTVTLTVTGSGKTAEEAKTNALRSAIEQSFGAFISSKAEILNEKLISEEIISLTNGNIQKIDVINESILPNGTYSITLKTLVSLQKLTEFSKSKGIAIEFEGGLFAANIRQKRLMEQAELKAVWNTLFMLNPILNSSFDYKITANTPIEVDHDKNIHQVSFEVQCSTNKNIDVIANILNDLMNGIALSKDEKESIEKMGIKNYPIFIDNQIYFLRNQESIKALALFFDEIKYIERRFLINDGLEKFTGNSFIRPCKKLEADKCLIAVKGVNDSSLKQFEIDVYGSEYEGLNYSGFEKLNEEVDFLDCDRKGLYYYESNCINGYVFKKSNEEILKFIGAKKYSLDQLEKVKSYEVFPLSKTSSVGMWKYGGKVFYEDTEKYLISSFSSFEIETYNNGYEIDRSKWKEIENIRGINDISIGSGKKNTENLFLVYKEYNTPFKTALQYNYDNYNDWYIPSRNEIEVMMSSHILTHGTYISYFDNSKGLDKYFYGYPLFTSSLIDRNNENLYIYSGKYNAVGKFYALDNYKFYDTGLFWYEFHKMRYIPIRTQKK